ncbi:hypothetical protein BLD44_021245 [Mastigocladus laminosus UU774]|nr:hypothetical protein BLD44_021245 [Mastigocladus laminosus UU774]
MGNRFSCSGCVIYYMTDTSFDGIEEADDLSGVNSIFQNRSTERSRRSPKSIDAPWAASR